jgi:hypothetical protein
MANLKELEAQMHPQLTDPTIEDRLKIANAAQFDYTAPNTPYTVQWDGQRFYSDDTGDLVDQVCAWLARPEKERAKDLKERMASIGG